MSERQWLREYDPRSYPPFAVTVDLAVFTLRGDDLCVLLVRRGEYPHRGRWALPGGHVLHGRESADDAAHRELLEETGVDAWRSNAHLQQLAAYSAPDRDPRMAAGLQVVSIAYVALAPGLPDAVAGTDAADARWTPVGAVPALAFDHDRILADAVERVRAKLEYTTSALHFVTAPFSLTELRRVYEAVWGRSVEPANFRRKVLATPGFVSPVDRAATAPGRRGGRPPELYGPGGAATVDPPIRRPM
ncbi:NUDIX hydrolase [Mycolicibacterium sediminis]|uniref:NUDIX hydrolase n=1 Tax=Mycolicibacterium sediminis TaxID=1286180 RepID=A0A7I7QZU6_9MYCO|nr:NUDIX domain-containing protein [Mycolicibacterium sediminis]BBY31894.1 NUDIX hydrolase [Mycolicibacterium sediminis]